MEMKTKEKKVKLCHPFERLETWSVTNLHGLPLFINAELQNWNFFNDNISLDVEHNNGIFVGLGIYATTRGQIYYWSDWDLVKQITIPKFVAHNGVSDLFYLKRWGFDVSSSHLVYDSYLMEHIIDSSQRDYSLTTLTKKHLGHYYPDFKEICGKDKTFADFPVEMVAEKNAADTYYTYQLMKNQERRLY